ncbi:HAD family hydrolase [Amnibacterium kyonggiense]
MPDATCSAVLFDIDGTLVDTNYLHVEAWSRAFVEVGHPVEAWRIHAAIGMDSAKLLGALLGDAAAELGDVAKERHAAHFADLADRIRALPHARDLLRELARRGLKVVLATSSPPEEFDRTTAVLDAGDAVLTATTSSDVDTAKPAPDVVGVALERAGVAAEDAVLVGDAVWDVRAAAAAGVRCIGVRSGGVGAGELREAGAVAVYDDAAALLDDLDRSPLFAR